MADREVADRALADRELTDRDGGGPDRRASAFGRASLLGMGVSAASIVLQDGVRWVETVTGSAQRALHELASESTTRIWLPSFVTLGIADVALATAKGGRTAKAMPIAGAIAGVGLIVASAIDLRSAQHAEHVLDATSDFAWGVQGLGYLTRAPEAARVASALGIAGALIQISAGAVRVRRGLRDHDRDAVKLGLLDLGGGVMWAGWDLAGWSHPLMLGSYVVLMVGREAFANKDALRAWLERRRASASAPPLLLAPSVANAVVG